jgi:vancomycin resistance protein YoaR
MLKNGKDAAVAYGSVDFKFKNNNSYPVKIYASVTGEEVNVRISKI